MFHFSGQHCYMTRMHWLTSLLFIDQKHIGSAVYTSIRPLIHTEQVHLVLAVGITVWRSALSTHRYHSVQVDCCVQYVVPGHCIT